MLTESPRRPGRWGTAALLATLGLMSTGCASLGANASAPTPRLAASLKGSFVASSPDDGSEVQLRIEPLWLERWTLPDGIYLFVAIQPTEEGPWLQALYRLVPDRNGRAVVESWRFVDDTLNAVESPTALRRVEALAPSEFRHLRGCDIAFTLQANGNFFGEHAPRGACRNTHRGADYVWAQKTLSPNQMLWWERGFTDAGEIVWGPEEDAYLFERIER